MKIERESRRNAKQCTLQRTNVVISGNMRELKTKKRRRIHAQSRMSRLDAVAPANICAPATTGNNSAGDSLAR